MRWRTVQIALIGITLFGVEQRYWAAATDRGPERPAPPVAVRPAPPVAVRPAPPVAVRPAPPVAVRLASPVAVRPAPAVAVVGRPFQGRQRKTHKPVQKQKPPEPPPLPCGDYLSFQVLLDRQGFSPGEIDAKPGDNFTHAIIALQQARQVPLTTQPDCETWHALGGDKAGDLLTTYTITPGDVAGPFQPRIPPNLVEQAKLPALAYRSAIEELGERFHVSPALLQRMNRGVAFVAGKENKKTPGPPLP